jgi:hypothetical protein
MSVFPWEGGKLQMTDVQKKIEDQKLKILTQISELSRLLGMNPSDGSIDVYEPMTQKRMALPNWLSTTRDSFLKLSLSVSKALDIQLQ